MRIQALCILWTLSLSIRTARGSLQACLLQAVAEPGAANATTSAVMFCHAVKLSLPRKNVAVPSIVYLNICIFCASSSSLPNHAVAVVGHAASASRPACLRLSRYRTLQ